MGTGTDGDLQAQVQGAGMPIITRGWQGLLGQEAVARRLLRAVERHRLSHAYLFEGVRGVGKTHAAWLLGAALNCEAASRLPDPCGVCPSCRMIAVGSHPDVRMVASGGGSIKIEQIRELQGRAVLRPQRGRWKVFILEPAEDMTEQAQNALLKMLEEPLGPTVFLLVAHTLQGVRPTILSRCQRMPFGRVPVPVVEAALRERGHSAFEAELLAALSDGRLGWATRVDPQKLHTDRDEIIRLMGGMPGGGQAAIMHAAGEWEKRKDDVDFLFDLLQGWCRDLLVWAEAAGDPHIQALAVHRDRSQALAEQAGQWTRKGLVQAVAEVGEARRQLSRNVNFRLCVETLLLRLHGAANQGVGRS